MVLPLIVGAAEGELVRLDGCDKADGDEARSVAVGERAEEDAIDDREDGGGGSDAEHQGEDDGRGKDRIAPQTAEGVAQVLEGSFEPVAGSLLSTLLAAFFQAAEGDGCLPSRLGWGEALGDLRFDLALEVVLQLFVDGAAVNAKKAKADAIQELTKH